MSGGGVRTATFAKLDDFHLGLEKKIGLPNPRVFEGMKVNSLLAGLDCLVCCLDCLMCGRDCLIFVLTVLHMTLTVLHLAATVLYLALAVWHVPSLGLEKKIGLPNPRVFEGMKVIHCSVWLDAVWSGLI